MREQWERAGMGGSILKCQAFLVGSGCERDMPLGGPVHGSVLVDGEILRGSNESRRWFHLMDDLRAKKTDKKRKESGGGK
eukprot:1997570-Rhodomonas_salina.1